MSELRRDKTTGRWVIIAPGRNQRPGPKPDKWEAPPDAADFDPYCPFCPGNEGQLIGLVEEIAADEPPGWRTRVVPNRYPIVAPSRRADGGATTALSPGHGYHEVVIESPRHDGELTTLSDEGMMDVLVTYRRRYANLMQRAGIQTVIVFRNQGRRAGASLVHPHSQITALNFLPPRLQSVADWARERHRETGTCVVCADMADERAETERLVTETSHFLATVPYAASGPFEICLTPKQHRPSFADADDEELMDLGRLLQTSVARLNSVLPAPAYKYVIESIAEPGNTAAHLHWRLRITPDITHPGGFELATGLAVNPALPEGDAQALIGAAHP